MKKSNWRPDRVISCDGKVFRYSLITFDDIEPSLCVWITISDRSYVIKRDNLHNIDVLHNEIALALRFLNAYLYSD